MINWYGRRFQCLASVAVASLLMFGAPIGAAEKVIEKPNDLKEFRPGDFNDRSTIIDN